MRSSGRKVVSLLFALMVGGYQLAGSSRSGAGGQNESAPQKPPNAGEQATFSHKSKKHSELDCARCHSVTRDKIDVKEFPTHDACISCHNFAAEMVTHGNAFCGVCHESKPISKSQPALLRFPKPRTSSEFGYHFSHVSHLKSQEVDVECAQAGDRRAAFIVPNSGIAAERQPQCADCHRRTEPAGNSATEMTIETGHAACFKCHCEVPMIRPAMPGMQDCAKCHRIDGPRSPRLFNVVKAFRHGDHELDTRPKRKADLRNARPADYLCAECHQAVAAAGNLNEIKLPEVGRCNQCHNGKAGLPDGLAKDVVDSLKRR